MPIEVKCEQCGKGLKAPDALAGKKAKCPACGSVIVVPAAEDEILDAELVEPTPAASDHGGLGDLLDDEIAYKVQEPEATQAESAESRRPCPACGEMIPTGAAKCRFCNEIFDSALKRKAQKKSSGADDDLSGGEWVLAILCSGIGCIVGIIWVIQGKKKGWKMVGISLAVQFIFGIIQVILQEANKR